MDMVIFAYPGTFQLAEGLQGALFAPLHPPNSFLCLCKERRKETHIGELKFPYAPLRNGIASRCLDEEKVTNLAGTVAKAVSYTHLRAHET